MTSLTGLSSADWTPSSPDSYVGLSDGKALITSSFRVKRLSIFEPSCPDVLTVAVDETITEEGEMRNVCLNNTNLLNFKLHFMH